MILFDIIYTAASDTFIQVGTFVAITLLLFGYINYKTHGNLITNFIKHKKLQVFFGALLGLTPGCGGAILVMPLYLKGQVSFGTVLATLTATMGDAAFVLLVSAPQEFIAISIIAFFTAIIIGYTYDFINKNAFHIPYTEEKLQENQQFQPEQTEFNTPPCECCQNTGFIRLPKIQKGIYYFRHHIGFIIIWLISILALPLGVLNLMQVDFNTAFPIKNLGLIGVIGTFFCIFYNILTKKIFADDSLPETKSKQSSLRETLIHNAEDTAFVVMWVFLALLCYEVGVYLIGGEDVVRTLLSQHGYTAVLIALFVGLIPGCGPHIIIATLYSQGLIPFSALLANAICNDGDALFPLLAMDQKSALKASLYGLIPAFILGTVAYLLQY